MVKVIKENWVDSIPIGARVMANDGFFPRFGRVYGRQRSRWGSSLRIKMDDYSFESCESFNDGPGIGWFLAGSPHFNQVADPLNRKAVA